jgi:peptide/nickel transport system permease protein
MIDTLQQPFIVAARARGLPARIVLLRHALRNATGPLVAIVMVDAALLVSGAVVTESVFAGPGIGSLFTEALARRDYSVLMALLIITSTAIVVLNVVADVAHALLDPRVTVTCGAHLRCCSRASWRLRSRPRPGSRWCLDCSFSQPRSR